MTISSIRLLGKQVVCYIQIRLVVVPGKKEAIRPFLFAVKETKGYFRLIIVQARPLTKIIPKAIHKLQIIYL